MLEVDEKPHVAFALSEGPLDLHAGATSCVHAGSARAATLEQKVNQMLRQIGAQVLEERRE